MYCKWNIFMNYADDLPVCMQIIMEFNREKEDDNDIATLYDYCLIHMCFVWKLYSSRVFEILTYEINLSNIGHIHNMTQYDSRTHPQVRTSEISQFSLLFSISTIWREKILFYGIFSICMGCTWAILSILWVNSNDRKFRACWFS